ncbi:hypothetical protein [uncultured Victivallis sp.]|uniref:hypothetical protein n=1 Tax=Victivallis sp. TaxID=2049020 RepID=UPI00345C2330
MITISSGRSLSYSTPEGMTAHGVEPVVSMAMPATRVASTPLSTLRMTASVSSR